MAKRTGTKIDLSKSFSSREQILSTATPQKPKITDKDRTNTSIKVERDLWRRWRRMVIDLQAMTGRTPHELSLSVTLEVALAELVNDFEENGKDAKIVKLVEQT